MGREINKEKIELICGVNSRAMVKNMKYSVSRFITTETGDRHEYKCQTSSNTGMNDKVKGDSTVATIKAIATYIFKRTVIPQLWRLIITPI